MWQHVRLSERIRRREVHRHVAGTLGARHTLQLFNVCNMHGLPQVAIQIAVLAAHVATLNRSPRNPIPNKENSRGTVRDFSFASRLWVIGSYEMPRCDWLQHCNFLAGIEILPIALQTACKPCGFAAGRPAIVAGPVLRVATGESCSVCRAL